MYRSLAIGITVAAAWLPPLQAATADDGPGSESKRLPKTVPVLDGAPPEGFTIGKGKTAYNASIDGSIYRVNLSTGEGDVLVPVEPGFDLLAGNCFKLGLRLDPPH